MTNIPPTTLDITRSILRLDENASIGASDTVVIHGSPWTRLELRASVADCLGYTAGKTVNLFKVTKRDVSLMLAAHGASTFTIEQHAAGIARIMRADFKNHTWSGTI